MHKSMVFLSLILVAPGSLGLEKPAPNAAPGVKTPYIETTPVKADNKQTPPPRYHIPEKQLNRLQEQTLKSPRKVIPLHKAPQSQPRQR